MCGLARTHQWFEHLCFHRFPSNGKVNRKGLSIQSAPITHILDEIYVHCLHSTTKSLTSGSSSRRPRHSASVNPDNDTDGSFLETRRRKPKAPPTHLLPSKGRRCGVEGRITPSRRAGTRRKQTAAFAELPSSGGALCLPRKWSVIRRNRRWQGKSNEVSSGWIWKNRGFKGGTEEAGGCCKDLAKLTQRMMGEAYGWRNSVESTSLIANREQEERENPTPWNEES